MSEKIIRIPISYSQRRKNIMGPNVVECQVSGRHLKFHEKSAALNTGEFITLDVMTMPEENNLGKKICQLIVTREDLLEALKHVSPSD